MYKPSEVKAEGKQITAGLGIKKLNFGSSVNSGKCKITPHVLFVCYQRVTKIKAFTQNHSVHDLWFCYIAPVLRSYSDIHCIT